MAMGVENRAGIPIELSRASLGDADNVFAVLSGKDRRVLVAWVPREDIMVDEQKLTGSIFTGKLMVEKLS